MSNALIPEFSVSDWQQSKAFYCEVLGFELVYERPEEGFAYLKLGEAVLMIDQIGLGRTFDNRHSPTSFPFGKGLNVQIRVEDTDPLLVSLKDHAIALYLPLEERWYRKDDVEVGNRQFVVADPGGYLSRFYEDLGARPVGV
ncbi:MAG: VOC family protein [Roseibium sp.]